MLEIVKATRAGVLTALALCALVPAAAAQPVSEEELDRLLNPADLTLGGIKS